FYHFSVYSEISIHILTFCIKFRDVASSIIPQPKAKVNEMPRGADVGKTQDAKPPEKRGASRAEYSER
ncbi:MAG: hypothetical protein ACI4J8_08835, partial [Oscillospiraceae bacterium]